MNSVSQSCEPKANKLFRGRYLNECKRVHRFMIWLMVAQWFVGIAFAAFYSPLTWIGQNYETHIHIWAAIILGGSISGFAILWIRLHNESAHTRHVVAICQMLWSALLIHLSGGRIETHFHVFASLAILSIYRDWKILITATVVVAVDHFIRGVFYPLSAFGVVTESPYRWIEHAAWVLLEVAFLAPGCMRLRNEIRELCVRQTEIEEAKKSVDIKVDERTRELSAANHMLAQKTAEAEKLALVARYTDNAVVITDDQSKIEWVNNGFSRVTGYQPDEVIGKRQSEFLYGPATDPEQRELIQSAMHAKEGCDTELVNYDKAGDPFWLSVEIRPIHDADGKVIKFIAIQRDISEKRQREHNLRLLRTAVDHANDSMFRIKEDGRIVDVNEIACQRLGYTPDELLNLTVPDISTVEDWEDRWNRIKTEQAVLLDGEHVTRDGRKFPVEVSAVFVADDQDEYICAFVRDITERREADIERQRLNEQLVEASRTAGMAEVATGVLHNVGNILNSVNVSAAVIRQTLRESALANLERVSLLIAEHEHKLADFLSADNRGQQIPNYLAKVTDALKGERDYINGEFHDLVKNIEHIKEIVAVQQALARPSGMLQSLSPAELVTDSITANKGTLTNHKINIQPEIEKDMPVVKSDKHRIMQILVNLIKNAKDALVEHQVSDPAITVRASSTDSHVIFEVRDNGVGISPDKVNKIFQHGFTTKENGHGFGLHYSANAASELGGMLTLAKHDAESGATFRLEVPRIPANEMETPVHSTTAT